MLTLYKSDSCSFCDKTLSLLKLYFDIKDIKIDHVKNLNIKYFRVPVLKVNNDYITDYNNFSDFLDKLNNLLDSNINLDDIYNKLMKIIYSLNEEDSEEVTEQILELFNIMKINDINYYHSKGYLLSHHIISSGNSILIKKFLGNFYDKLNSFKTTTYIMNNTTFKIYIPSGQNLKHIAAQNNPELYPKLKIISEIEDECGYYPIDYFNNRNNLEFIKNINRKISDKYEISFDINNIYIENFENDLIKNNLIEEIKFYDKIQPNSMHKTGVILDKKSKNVKEFVNLLDDKFNLKLDKKVYDIYAFTAEYSDCTNNYLDMHKDNSIITINWNLEVSDNIEGTDLVIPSMEKIITPKKNQLIIHHGKLDHQVMPRNSGSRKNLIIWLK